MESALERVDIGSSRSDGSDSRSQRSSCERSASERSSCERQLAPEAAINPTKATHVQLNRELKQRTDNQVKLVDDSTQPQQKDYQVHSFC